MQLSDEQKQQVSQWIAAGATLAEIQSRLGEEFQIRLTYMDARLLVDDLKLTPQDPPEPEKPAATEPAPGGNGEPGIPDDAALDEPLPADDLLGAEGSGKVNVTVDTLTRPGAIVSG